MPVAVHRLGEAQTLAFEQKSHLQRLRSMHLPKLLVRHFIKLGTKTPSTEEYGEEKHMQSAVKASWPTVSFVRCMLSVEVNRTHTLFETCVDPHRWSHLKPS